MIWQPYHHFELTADSLDVVPVGYAEPATFTAGTPYGASSVSENQSKAPSEYDLKVARYQGQRVAKVAAALKAMKEGLLTSRERAGTDRVHA